MQGTLQNEPSLWVAAAELFCEQTAPDSAAALTLREILQIQWKAEFLCQEQAEERERRRDSAGTFKLFFTCHESSSLS